MRVDQLLIRGIIHETWCEDAQFQSNLTEKLSVYAIMDGCSSAKASYFASAILVKLLQKTCSTITDPFLNMFAQDPEQTGKKILEYIFNELKSVQKLLMLEIHELLSTLYLAVHNTDNNRLWINTSGDGFISVNNKIFEIGQNNMPDYMAYHLDLDFNTWLTIHSTSYVFDKIRSFALSTDGINKYMGKNNLQPAEFDTATYLLSTDNNMSLLKKHHYLCNKLDFYPFDDISIIKIII